MCELPEMFFFAHLWAIWNVEIFVSYLKCFFHIWELPEILSYFWATWNVDKFVSYLKCFFTFVSYLKYWVICELPEILRTRLPWVHLWRVWAAPRAVEALQRIPSSKPKSSVSTIFSFEDNKKCDIRSQILLKLLKYLKKQGLLETLP